MEGRMVAKGHSRAAKSTTKDNVLRCMQCRKPLNTRGYDPEELREGTVVRCSNSECRRAMWVQNNKVKECLNYSFPTLFKGTPY